MCSLDVEVRSLRSNAFHLYAINPGGRRLFTSASADHRRAPPSNEIPRWRRRAVDPMELFVIESHFERWLNDCK